MQGNRIMNGKMDRQWPMARTRSRMFSWRPDQWARTRRRPTFMTRRPSLPRWAIFLRIWRRWHEYLALALNIVMHQGCFSIELKRMKWIFIELFPLKFEAVITWRASSQYCTLLRRPLSRDVLFSFLLEAPVTSRVAQYVLHVAATKNWVSDPT